MVGNDYSSMFSIPISTVMIRKKELRKRKSSYNSQTKLVTQFAQPTNELCFVALGCSVFWTILSFDWTLSSTWSTTFNVL